ncbi:CRISPR-associated protein [Eubacterium pyruvativorans]|uniref:CRISPR-associated protein n=1 Tax=Eubacterium pyruvativorans TaxID=155865 RepID=UPI003F8BBAB7
MKLGNRYEIVSFVQAVMCNPNGDPDMDNRPRIDEETGKAFMTDVSIKGRIRGYVDGTRRGEKDVNGNGLDILIRHGESLNRDIAEAVLNGQEGGKIDDPKHFKNTSEGVSEARNFILQKYWDARVFGAVLSTGLNAGQINGPVQFAFSESVDPVTPEIVGITRKAFAKPQGENDTEDFGTLRQYDEWVANIAEEKKRGMGNKKMIPYALFPVMASVSAGLAKNSGMTEEDLQLLIQAWARMYDYNISASKMGMASLLPIFVFKHVGTQKVRTNQDEKAREQAEKQNASEALLGCAPAYQIFELLSAKKKDDVDVPRGYRDYDVVFHKSDLPDGVVVGVADYSGSINWDIDWDNWSNEYGYDWIKVD